MRTKQARWETLQRPDKPSESVDAVCERYEIRVHGPLDPEEAEAFGGLSVSSSADGTSLVGWLDQAGLFGVLDRIQALGLRLVEVRRVGRRSGPDDR